MRYLKPFNDVLGVMRTPGDKVPSDLPATARAHYEKHFMIGELADDHPLVVAADARVAAAEKAAQSADATRDAVVKGAQGIAESNKRLGTDDDDGDSESADGTDDEPETYKELDAIADKARDKARRYERQLESETDPAKIEKIQPKFEAAQAEALETRAAADAVKPE